LVEPSAARLVVAWNVPPLLAVSIKYGTAKITYALAKFEDHN
jgi:hypothetical protein